MCETAIFHSRVIARLVVSQVAFFKRAVDALDGSPHACVVLKENTLRSDEAPPEVDTNDASLTRSVSRWLPFVKLEVTTTL